MKILIVEDEPSLNKIIAKRLKIEAYSVDSAFNGKEALISSYQVLFSIPWFRSLVLGSPSLIGYWLSLRCPFVVYNTPCHSRL